MELREATVDDVEAVATLHAESWRRSYRGAYADEFLDGDVHRERAGVWQERLGTPAPGAETLVAHVDGRVVGFVHTVLDEDPRWGALIDNLHVAHETKGRGVGTALMAASAATVLARRPGSGLFLWVLEVNAPARRFYAARGGRQADRRATTPPGGGSVMAQRIVWPDPSVLLVPSGPTTPRAGSPAPGRA